MDRNGTKAAGYFSLNVPAKKGILKIIYTIVFHCCQWNYKLKQLCKKLKDTSTL